MYSNVYSDGKLCLSIKESNDHLFTFLEYIKKEVNIMFNLPESFFEVDFMIYLMIKTIRQNLEHLRFFCVDTIGMDYASSIILPLDPAKHSEAFDVWALYDTEGDLEIFNFNFIYDEDILGSDFENLRQKYKC